MSYIKDENCVFCKIVAGEIPSYKVFETENLFVFLDINPIKKGHTLIIPKYHVSDILDTTTDEYHSIYDLGKFLAKKIKKILGVPRIGMVVEGFGVNHAHLHLIPITAGNQLNPEKAYKASKEELEEVQKLYLQNFN